MQEKKGLKSNVLFESLSGNFYLQSSKDNSCIYLHPGLLEAMNFVEKDNEKSSKGLYYKRKLEFLKRHYSPDELYSRQMTFNIPEKLVLHNMINIQQVVFEVTDKCNLNCTYCGYGDLYSGFDKRETKHLSWGKSKLILDYFIKLWGENMYPSVHKPIAIGFYGGEPLLNFGLIKDIVQYTEINRPEGLDFTYHMTTNGLLLDRFIEELVEKDVHLSISLDGNDQNNSYRLNKNGINVWQKITDNLAAVESKFPIYFEKRVSFISVLHNRNTISEILSFFKTNFNKIPTILEVSSDGIVEEKKDEFNKIFSNKREDILNTQEINEVKDDLFIADPDTKSMMDYVFRFTNNVISDYQELFVEQNNVSFFPTGTCMPFGKKVFITVNGKILPCERIDQKFTLGKIDKGNVKINPKLVADSQSAYYNSISNQ